MSLTEEKVRTLLEAAKLGQANSYSPYSRFPVGAAILTENGKVFTGCNVENAAYGPTICAEQTAVVKAVSEGVQSFIAIAIVGPNEHLSCSPCGTCRQILSEFSPDMAVYTEVSGEIQYVSLRDLLPGGFDKSQLPPRG